LNSLNSDIVKRFDYSVLQEGSIILKPDGQRIVSLEHRCTSVLLWTRGSLPSSENTVLTDPCFTDKGFLYAMEVLEELKLPFEKIGRIFVTHRHSDHCLSLPQRVPVPAFPYLGTDELSGLFSIPCPGHSPSLKSLVFRSCSGEKIWIVGDAILDEEWLMAWEFFWPNGYTRGSVIKTWNSVARIISNADVIVPGHGKPFKVTLPLLEKLLSDFPAAKYAEACGKAADMMADRLNRLKKRELTS